MGRTSHIRLLVRPHSSRQVSQRPDPDFAFLQDSKALNSPSTEDFGRLIRKEHYEQQGGRLSDKFTSKVELHDEEYLYETLPSPFRKEDGSFIQGKNAEEARLDPRTLRARVDSSIIALPPKVSRAIGEKILLQVAPGKLRERAAQIYQSLERDQIQKAPELGLEADAHIAALFLQNYAHARRVLLELKKRVGPSFSPDSVLDIGYGPATGMVALNEIMGSDFAPSAKDVYVVGRLNFEMKRRAKIILATQEGAESSETNAVGDSVSIKTKLRDTLPSAKEYDLIMVHQSLLSREYNFPKDVDINLHMILRLLKPNGHLVIIERGNALGFEIVARARQVMLRPESHQDEHGRIPRPYIRGSSVKPQKIRREDQIITEEHVQYEQELLEAMELEDEAMKGEHSALEAEITEKYGEVSAEELDFEFENDEDFEILPMPTKSQGVNYHLSVVAPCSHHGRCPLQLGDPKFYQISNHKHRLQFCSYNQVVERPKYTMELKKGKRLATTWDKLAEDGFGAELLPKKTLLGLQGSGRPGGKNSELGNFSYLIMHRAPNDPETLAQINDDREHYSEKEEALPRILESPSKVKKNVKLKMCAPSGNVEEWQIPRSFGKQAYHDARKAKQGDLWALGRKGAVVKSRLSESKFDKLKKLAGTQRKFVVKEKRKRETKKIVSRAESDFEDPLAEMEELALQLENSKKYRTAGKKAKFDVDVKKYEGK